MSSKRTYHPIRRNNNDGRNKKKHKINFTNNEKKIHAVGVNDELAKRSKGKKIRGKSHISYIRRDVAQKCNFCLFI